ncbi:unnamed protein product [Lupinus luteus]|uniref:Uncharacterized protein n=1 Tax=Lupinus luteus TaxID=3873 RepID=A0AAV1XFU1_LUPLU
MASKAFGKWYKKQSPIFMERDEGDDEDGINVHGLGWDEYEEEDMEEDESYPILYPNLSHPNDQKKKYFNS